MQLIYWFTAALAITGVVLNIRKHVACFYVWAVTNATWAWVDWTHGLYAQSSLMALYFLLSLWGIWKWSQEKNENHDGKKNPN